MLNIKLSRYCYYLHTKLVLFNFARLCLLFSLTLSLVASDNKNPFRDFSITKRISTQEDVGYTYETEVYVASSDGTTEVITHIIATDLCKKKEENWYGYSVSAHHHESIEAPRARGAELELVLQKYTAKPDPTAQQAADRKRRSLFAALYAIKLKPPKKPRWKIFTL